MDIGIIGTGNMGRAIGIRLARLGHKIMFGSREPRGAEDAVGRAGHGAIAGTNDDAARHGEILIWTIRDPDPAAVLTQPALLDGKIVININNRDYESDVRAGKWFEAAIAEQFQAHAPRARVVKALNTIAMEALDTSAPALRDAGAQVFIAGDDAAAKGVVSGLLSELGFATTDLGAGPAAMRAAEALGDVIRLLMIGGGIGGQANLQLRLLPKPDLALIGQRAASAYQ